MEVNPLIVSLKHRAALELLVGVICRLEAPGRECLISKYFGIYVLVEHVIREKGHILRTLCINKSLIH